MNDDDYSATELGSHWIQRPVSDTAAPDRVDGAVLRFGPGVTAAAVHRAQNTPTAAQIWHGTLPGGTPVPGPPPRRRWARRYALAAVVLVVVLAILAWWRFGPGVAVRSVAVSAPQGELGCDGTADVVGVVRTDGRRGVLTYRWERSDGTVSQPLTERLARGQREARLHLLWTFHGPGVHRATARLVITDPTVHHATGSFTYRCI
ncbi:hypothetical protein ABZO31_33200 [Streptomyces sp. HUAS MG47]|uniref:hypothetical protein n=1 Tax=Streptomyces solicamelliae TaxID=3231716 RepID=UPI003877EDA3